MTLQIPFDNSYARLPERFYQRTRPEPVRRPQLIRVNRSLARELGMDPDALTSPDGVAMFAGNLVPPGSDPIAQAYAGHQFGGWSPRLGDGRAVLLGEVVDTHGIRRDIQLKGSGRTAFSRGGDGRSWLGPVLREYLVSEAFHALGIPTTRALAAVTTGETVPREYSYPGAVLTRVASSHIRVGTFQYFAAQRDIDGLRELMQYVIARHYPDATDAFDLLRGVMVRQIKLVTQWLGVGFIHGVMNTDNTHINGDTIDFGPCAFMDEYVPDKVFSSIDHAGRYAYSRQPDVLLWNLAQLATALLPLMGGDEAVAVKRATDVLEEYDGRFQTEWRRVFGQKLGLESPQPSDDALIREFLGLMAAESVDFTNTFRAVGTDRARGEFLNMAAYDAWESAWKSRIQDQPSPAAPVLRANNPAYIPRNHRIEQAIQAGLAGDFAPFERLLSVLARPYEDQADAADLALPPEEHEVVHHTFCGT